MNILLAVWFVFAINTPLAQDLTARQVLDKCRERADRIDSLLDTRDVEFTQKIKMESKGGQTDEVIFKITVRHGELTREFVSGTVPNGDRFNGGYDAFDKMFFLSQYFSRPNGAVSSCDLDDSETGGDYDLDFSISKSSTSDDPYTTVNVSVDKRDYTPLRIEERLSGLPLGVEFHDYVNVSYDAKAGMYYPTTIIMKVYGRFYFLKGQVAVITITNSGLRLK